MSAGSVLGPRRRALLAASMVALGLVAAPLPAGAAGPWWQLAAFQGRSVTRVTMVSGRLVAVVGGMAMEQTQGGGFVPTAQPPAPASAVTAGGLTWSIDPSGQVLVSHSGGSPRTDPGSPDLGAGADLIAAPVSTAGVVLAVSTGGVVWCRSATGGWSASLVLLPTTLLTGTPAVTSIAAFNQRPLSDAVYLGTNGYGTLLTDDAGADWTRADPGLPDAVLSLASDPAGQGALWAGTADGLYVHHLQVLPGIPIYSGESLTGKWLVTAGLCVIAVLLAGAVLLLWARRASPQV